MTRRNRREIEREVDSLKAESEASDSILFIRETDAGGIVTLDGEGISEERLAQAPLVFKLTDPPE